MVVYKSPAIGGAFSFVLRNCHPHSLTFINLNAIFINRVRLHIRIVLLQTTGMQKALLFLLFFIINAAAIAQKISVKGRVVDSAGDRGLAYATVSLVKATDSTLVTFARADSAGYFKLTNVFAGNYLISTSYVGHLPVWQPITVTNGDPVFNAGSVYMADTASLLGVRVLAKRPPVEINNDTLEFNTENFKTQPNAVVEDMLKKMPGITVDANGTVKVNGQTVKRVLVNLYGGRRRQQRKNN